MPIQEQVRKMVDEHVMVNATIFISNLLHLNMYEQVWDILGKPDYESAARDEDCTVEKQSDGFYYYPDHQVPSGEGPYDTEHEAWQAACDDNGIEPYQDEAYEWYIVDDWLAGRLEQKSEMIDYDIMGFTIWGRCATGQAVYLDEVMEQICSETPWYMREDDV